MLLDFLNEFCDAEDMFGSGTTEVSTGRIDLGAAAPPQLQNGAEVKVYWQVTTAFAGGTSANIQLATNDDETATTPTVHDETGAIAVATLVAGYGGTLTLPRRNPAPLEFLMILVVNAGANTAGAINAGIVWDDHSNEQAVWTGVSAVTGF